MISAEIDSIWKVADVLPIYNQNKTEQFDRTSEEMVTVITKL